MHKICSDDLKCAAMRCAAVVCAVVDTVHSATTVLSIDMKLGDLQVTECPCDAIA